MAFDSIRMRRKSLAALVGVSLALAAVAGEAQAGTATMTLGSGSASWATDGDYASLQLRVTGPNGFLLERSFAAGTQPSFAFFDRAGQPLADGTYRYELTLVPQGLRTRTDQEAQQPGDASLRGAIQSGHILIEGGQAVLPGQAEPAAPGAGGRAAAPSPDTTFTDSLCVGFDCPASPSFSDTTILMMENNTRIKFDDTSASAGFPNRDWSLVANDSASGGLNRFFVQDCGTSSAGGCTGNAVFSIEAGARANALYVDDGGRLGLGTAAPVLDIHNKRTNTPSLRLEQDSSGGFTAQTWDVAGNEANFFVRDVTGGSRLPFRIRPGAPTNSIDIDDTGNVGIGTAGASAPLHVKRSDATAKLTVEETNSTVIGRNLMQLVNNGAPTLRFDNTANGQFWSFGQLAGGNFFFGATPGQPLAVQIDTAGNVTTTGTVNGVSDRNAKADIVAVDAQAVLARVAELPISTWRFKQASELHMGPMAQDFSAAFGLGSDDTHIALNDLSGVALAAVKALNEVVTAKDARLVALEQQNADLATQNARLAERLAALEAAVQAPK